MFAKNDAASAWQDPWVWGWLSKLLQGLQEAVSIIWITSPKSGKLCCPGSKGFSIVVQGLENLFALRLWLGVPGLPNKLSKAYLH